MYYIYGTSSCPYCDYAKDILESRTEQYEYFDVTMDQGLIDMFKMNGWKTVPQIFYENEHIGGYTELKKLLGGE